jgi:hypothetical protein
MTQNAIVDKTDESAGHRFSILVINDDGQQNRTVEFVKYTRWVQRAEDNFATQRGLLHQSRVFTK